jgi:quinol monooxygenase YgiN
VAYVFSEDLDEAGVYRIFEEWKSQADLDAHVKSPHMGAFQKVVPTLGIRGMKLQRYEVSSVGPLR